MTDITSKYSFLASVVIDDDIIPNQYAISLGLASNTKNVHEQSVAISRLKLLFNDMCSNSAFVSIVNPSIGVLLQDFSTNIVFCPEEPYDQIIAMLLYSKASAIIEERFFVDSIALSSLQGDHIIYNFNLDEYGYPPTITAEMIKDEHPWWRRSDLSMMDIIKVDDDGKESLEPQEISWEDIGLGWAELEIEKPKKEGKIIKTKFKPKVIDGDEKK